MLIDVCIKFREYSLSGFQVIERTRFVTDRQTDRRTDRQTDARGKTICLPTLKGGDIIQEDRNSMKDHQKLAVQRKRPMEVDTTRKIDDWNKVDIKKAVCRDEIVNDSWKSCVG